jgi:mannose-1-phosphate guanylyltransferase
MSQRGNVWAVVLAGGEGRRIAHLTLDALGRAVPKQFWRVDDRRTPLDAALERASRLARPSHVVAVVVDAQRRWWQPQLSALLPENVLSQPVNRGTAVALLHAVIHILRDCPAATIVVFPSDHEADDESVLADAAAGMVHATDAWPDHIVVLGAPPAAADTEYGWIVPGRDRGGEPVPVASFVEKPNASEARRLMGIGGVWNTFVLAANGWALVHAYQRAVPELFHAYLAAIDEGRLPARAARRAYPGLPRVEFGRDLLERVTAHLRLAMLPPCGWIDLGTPERMDQWLAHRGQLAMPRGRAHAPGGAYARPVARATQWT